MEAEEACSIIAVSCQPILELDMKGKKIYYYDGTVFVEYFDTPFSMDVFVLILIYVISLKYPLSWLSSLLAPL